MKLIWNGILITGYVTNLTTTSGSLTMLHLGTTSYPIYFAYVFNPRDMFFTFFVNDVKDIDTAMHKVTLDIVMEISWQDTRLACPTFVKVTTLKKRNSRVRYPGAQMSSILWL